MRSPPLWMTHEAHSVLLRSHSVRPEKCCAGAAVSVHVVPLPLLPPVELLDALGGHAQARAAARPRPAARSSAARCPSAPRWSARRGGRSGRARGSGLRSAARPASATRRLVEALGARPREAARRARPNTGSISHHLPRSLSRCDEWPRRMMWLDCGVQRVQSGAVQLAHRDRVHGHRAFFFRHDEARPDVPAGAVRLGLRDWADSGTCIPARRIAATRRSAHRIPARPRPWAAGH